MLGVPSIAEADYFTPLCSHFTESPSEMLTSNIIICSHMRAYRVEGLCATDGRAIHQKERRDNENGKCVR
jgi:hypothetical protein